MSQNLEKDTPIQAQEAYGIPNKLDQKRNSIPRNISELKHYKVEKECGSYKRKMSNHV